MTQHDDPLHIDETINQSCCRHIADDISYISDRPQGIVMSTVRIVLIMMIVMMMMMVCQFIKDIDSLSLRSTDQILINLKATI